MNAGASPQAAAQASRQASANGRGTAKRTLAGRRMTVLQAALRVRTHRAMTSPDEQDAHTRHVGTAWRHQSDGIAGAVEAARPARAQQAAGVDLRHQTLAAWPETRRGSAETGRCAAAALAEWGSTTGQRQLVRSRRGPAPWVFSF